MIRIARGKAAAQGVTNVTFQVAPFDDAFTGLAPRSLDGVCAFSLLHLVEDRSATLRRVFEVLRPGGLFVSSTPCLGGSWVPFGPLLGVLRALGKAPTVQLFSKVQLVEDIRGAGFVGLSEPEVGARPNIAFVLANKAS
jgi:SAM-dependent methyltransferase